MPLNKCMRCGILFYKLGQYVPYCKKCDEIFTQTVILKPPKRKQKWDGYKEYGG